jgi:hypothetical protein
MSIVCEAISGETIRFAHLIDGQPYPEIGEWGKKFEGSVLRYKLTNLSDDIEISRHQHRAVVVAFRVWQLRVRDIKFVRARGNESYDLEISFKPLSEFASPGVLAHATYPGQSQYYIEINDEWDWVTNTHVSDLGHPPLVPVLIHEIGHCLGLVHDQVENEAIMYPSFNLGAKKNSLHTRDVERIQWLYGARNLSQRIIDYFRNRRSQGWDFD